MQEGGIGRTNAAAEGGAQQQEQSRDTARDISEIDRQEGTMNNGILGGNFDNPDSDTSLHHKSNP